jgi:hypothetical protein
MRGQLLKRPSEKWGQLAMKIVKTLVFIVWDYKRKPDSTMQL